jgi:hypothetical protein
MGAMKQRLLLWMIVLAVCPLAHSQFFAVSGNCELPGQAALTSGLAQSGTQPLTTGSPTTGSGVIASFPQCQVTVYPANSNIPVPSANIHSDSTGDPLGNPFTANEDGSWVFYAAQACYDVVLSSGTTPASKMPAPKTLSGKCAGQGTGTGGTVTNVGNGTGITGGPITGSGTLSITPSFRLPQTCSNGQVPTWDSATSLFDICTSAGTGTVTSIANGTGLTGGPITGTGTLAIAGSYQLPQTCSNGQVPTWDSATSLFDTCLTGGTGNVSTAPAGSQLIVQPVSSGSTVQISSNNLANIRYVTAAWNWVQSPSDNLGTPGSVTIHLTSGPAGIDTASSSHNYIYPVYITAGSGGVAETMTVTGGTCTPGSGACTITGTTLQVHGSGYTVGSASQGIQEAFNDPWISDTSAAGQSQPPTLKLMGNTQYFVRSTIYTRGRNNILDGSGSSLICSTRSKCIKIGSSTAQNGGHIFNLQGLSTVTNAGVQTSSLSATSGTYTITTVQNHTFVAGDYVDCENHYTTTDSHWTAQVLSSGLTATQFQVAFGSSTISAGSGWGWCNLEDAFIEDGSSNAVVEDVIIDQLGGLATGNFTYGIVDDNDQTMNVNRIRSGGSGIISNSANWPIGAMFYSRTDQGNSGIMFISHSDATNNNFFTGASNGVIIKDSVCQGEPVFCVRYFGALQPAVIDSMYQDSGGTNPLYNQVVQMGLLTSGSRGTTIHGNLPLTAAAPAFVNGGSTTTQRNYFVVPRSSVFGYFMPLFIGTALPTSGSVSIPLTWPSIEMQDGFSHASIGTLTWDILVTIGQASFGTPSAPYGTGTYAIATNQGSLCSQGMCTFTDTQPSLSSYTVGSSAWYPQFWFWPAVVVNNNTENLGPTFMDAANQGGAYISASGTASGGGGPAVVAQQCFNTGSPSAYTNAFVWCPTGTGSNSALNFFQVATQTANSKGLENYGVAITAPNDLLTLEDNDPAKTKATAGGRPLADANDMAIGKDQSGGMSERAATSISDYIGTLNDGTSWLRRLTATGENYATNVAISGPRPWIDVTGPGYGADPTGVADSTTALNKAFTNCSGGTVYLPPNTGGGFYKHTGQLTISTAGCTIQSFAQGAVIKKSYNSTGGFPGSNGSFVITGSNTIIDGIAYDGNNGSFTGPCITFSTAVTQVIFQNNYVHNCDGNSLTFTGLNSGATGPSNFRVLNNTIIGGANGFPLQFSQDIEYFDIENNTFDGSAITLSGAGGPATLQLESQGLTTQISHGIIAHNTLISPNCSTGECWTVQLGQFNGYASTDIIYGPNLTLLSGNMANCGSFQGVRDSRFDLGVCESNTGVSDSQNYTMWEFILDNNIDITGGTINGEGPGNSEGIIFSSTSNSTLSGVTINGFGESSTSGVTAGLEVSAAAAGAAQAITSCSESGNIATYTVTTPPLQAAWQPPATVYFGGSYTPSGYGGGPYTVINTNYNRISGTFSVVLPVTGLGNCTGTGTVQTGSWNNTFSGITINFPVGIYGSLTSTLYGIQERCTLAGGCYTSDNHFSGITINGTPGTSVTETGISIQGTGTADSNTFTDIQLNNLTNGIASTVGTNNNIIKPRFVNVGTHVSGTTGLYIDYMAPNAVPTITGCGTVTSQLGNGFSGSFNAASGTCTVVITPGETAINAFRCSAADITTPADTFTQTAKSTTTCTLTGTPTSGDLIQFSAAAY